MNQAGQILTAQNSGLPRRLGAILYDSLLVLALWILVTIAFIAARQGAAVETDDNIVYQLCFPILVYAFFVGFWSWSGRTLGMQTWGLRVELPDGRLPGPGVASMRFFAAILSWLPLGLGFLWQLWDKDKLTWHDRLSGTRLMHYPKAK
jgi:uncharacterized RDD family membrane protein YckC